MYQWSVPLRVYRTLRTTEVEQAIVSSVRVLADGPRYVEALRAIEGAIMRGDLPPGTRLPSERDLSRALGISRLTLRRALDELIRAGRLRRIHGVGNFVREQRLELDDRLSFSERARQLGRVPSSRVLSVGVVPADREVANTLGLSPTAPLLRIDRIRLIDGIPVMRELTHLPASRYPALLNADLAVGSLYRLLDEIYGVRIAEIRETICAHLIDSADALLLACQAGAPGFRRDLISFTASGEVVEHCVGVVVGARTQYRFVVRGRGDLQSEVTIGYPVPIEGGDAANLTT